MTRTAIVGLILTATLCPPASLDAQVEIGARAARLTVGGRLHTQYASSSVDGAVEHVFVRRARITVDMALGEIVRGRVMPDFAGGETALQDAYLLLDLDEAFTTSFGQFKRAFSNFELNSSTDLPTVERDGRIPGLSHCAGVGGVCTFSRLTQKLKFDERDVGVRVAGQLGGRLEYMATLTNGEGINTADVNDGKSFSVRLATTAAEGMTVGVFGGLHDHLDGDDETRRAGAAGADVELGSFRSGFHLLAAAVAGENWLAGEEAGFRTAQALVSYYLPSGSETIEGLEPLLRASWGDPDDDGEEDSGFLLTPGVFLYVQGKNALGANLDWYSPAGEADAEWSLKLQAYLYF